MAGESEIIATPLTAAAFAPFGEVIETGSCAPALINEGACKRYNDLIELDMASGKPGLSLFHADIREIPYQLDLLERHPLGSQAFIPMENATYLVTVAEDEDGRPGNPVAFLAGGDQGVNIRRNTWHGVLTPLSGGGLFAVIDRIGEGDNLVEHRLDKPVLVKTEN